MQLLLDTHLHLYQCYDIDKALRALSDNLRLPGHSGPRAAFAPEAPGGISLGKLAAIGPDFRRFSLKILADGSLLLSQPDAPPLYLLPARQLATTEQLEVLALGAIRPIPDGLPAARAIEAILKAGGLPVLPWGAGKWLFHRQRAVSHIIRLFSPETLLLGDTSLRPACCPPPRPMRLARSRGFKIAAGSDPLPCPGEEERAGMYFNCVEAPFDTAYPMTSALNALKRADVPLHRLGSRSSLPESFGRWARHMQKRRKTDKQT